jgi:hypothetical protein
LRSFSIITEVSELLVSGLKYISHILNWAAGNVHLNLLGFIAVILSGESTSFQVTRQEELEIIRETVLKILVEDLGKREICCSLVLLFYRRIEGTQTASLSRVCSVCGC